MNKVISVLLVLKESVFKPNSYLLFVPLYREKKKKIRIRMTHLYPWEFESHLRSSWVLIYLSHRSKITK